MAFPSRSNCRPDAQRGGLRTFGANQNPFRASAKQLAPKVAQKSFRWYDLSGRFAVSLARGIKPGYLIVTKM